MVVLAIGGVGVPRAVTAVPLRGTSRQLGRSLAARPDQLAGRAPLSGDLRHPPAD